MVANGKVNVSIIELIKTTEDEHHQEKIMELDSPFYPTYKAGEILFLRTTVKGDQDKNTRLTQYKIVDVHHSIYQHFNNSSSLSPLTSFVNMHVYVRKID
jgi:hypothetical protein